MVHSCMLPTTLQYDDRVLRLLGSNNLWFPATFTPVAGKVMPVSRTVPLVPAKRCGGGTACPSFAAGAGRAVLVRARGALGPTMGALGCTGGARGSTAAGTLPGAGPERGAAAGPAETCCPKWNAWAWPVKHARN